MRKSFLKVCVSAVLAFTMIMSCAFTALAAPSRNKGNVKYLSEVALIEAKDQAEADNLLAELKKEENGAFDGMISLDLNKGGKTKVYLVYKTSTNVDDAITDLSVMNMNGNFTMGNYEQLFEQTLEGHKEVARDYRVMAAQFKANYEKGTRNALTAYRQLNYYYVEEDDSKTYMGDYMLNFPEDDEDFAEMLFRGNLKIIANVRTLLSMGIGDSDNSLIDRINAAYEAAATDESVYTNTLYDAAAKKVLDELLSLKSTLNNVESEIEQIKASDMEEEYKEVFIETKNSELDRANAFVEMLKLINLNGTTLAEHVMTSPVVEASELFPFVSAANDAERLLMEYGSVYDLLLYEELSLGENALDEALAELEKNYVPVSVYHGVQNDLSEGTIAVTGDAEMFSSSTGKSFFGIYANSDTQVGAVAYSLLGIAGVAGVIGGIAYLSAKHSAGTLAYANLVTAFTEAQERWIFSNKQLETYASMYNDFVARGGSGPAADNFLKEAAGYWDGCTAAEEEMKKASTALATQPNGMSTAQMIAGGLAITMGVVMMGVSIWRLVSLYNKYEVSYTDIPDNMVHVVSTDEYGDRFVNYKNVPAYYLKDGKMQSRENDLNAYDGNQWVSLYYTKNYEAGYCLTSTPDLIATESARAGYTGIHQFGRTSNYNLNSYCDREGAEAVYLAFKYSTNQKSAVTDVPEVVGSIFSYGFWIVAGGIGAIAGIGGTLGTQTILKRKKNKASNEEALSAEA